MKKILALVLALVMLLALCACGKKAEPEQAGLANPVHECSAQELLEKTGIALDAPEGATDVVYAYIDGDEYPVSQVQFTLNGGSYCYRAQPTNVFSIEASVDEDADAKSLSEALNSCTNVGAALSGMHYEWKCSALVDVPASREGVVAFNEGKEGFIAWLDVVPGVLYSLSTNKGANQQLLMDTAELVFVPLQGEAE